MSIRRLTEDSYKVRLFNGDGPFVAHRTLTDGIEPSLQSLIDAYGIDNDDVVPQPAVIDSGEMVVQEAVDALQEAVDAIQLEVDAVGGRNIQDLANVSLHLSGTPTGALGGLVRTATYINISAGLFYWSLGGPSDWWMSVNTAQSQPWWDSIGVGDTVNLWVDGTVYAFPVLSKYTTNGNNAVKMGEKSLASGLDLNNAVVTIEPNYDDPSNFAPLVDGDTLMMQDGKLKPVDLPALIEAAFVARGL